MKKIVLPMLLLLFVGFSSNPLKLTDEERTKAVEELTNTRDRMLTVIDGLSEAQLNFKSSPESWSVAECVEHLAISENMFDQMLSGALQAPADPAKRTEIKMADDQLMAMIVDRSNRVKTSEPFEPSGKFGSHEETVKAFASKRDEHIEYMKGTEDDLRHHYGQLPFGTIDAYQILMFMSGHTERHVRQMEEVIAAENFPSE